MPEIEKLTWDEIPEQVKKEINDENIEDILDRFNDEEHHNHDIEDAILTSHFIKLIRKKKYTVALSPPPVEFKIIASSRDEAIKIAKEQYTQSVYESEVIDEEVFEE